MKNKILFLLSLILFLPASAQAQVAADHLAFSPTTIPYLSKSYWLLNNLDPQDNENIDQYLMITECGLFQRYYKDDIEWEKIRTATRNYIIANKQSFPKTFEFTQPIFLDRYDTEKGVFTFKPKSQIVGVKQMQASGNRVVQDGCLDSSKYNPAAFPLNAIVTLPRPLNYTESKMDAATAEAYLKYVDDKHLSNQEGRPAYMRYRFKIDHSLTPIKGEQGVYANFFGSLESITIFGDRDLTMQLEEIKF